VLVGLRPSYQHKFSTLTTLKDHHLAMSNAL
jgi:hypothetical protein